MTMISKIKAETHASGLTVGLSGAASIRTPCGPRRVENLRPGDLVVTRDNGLQAVRLVWSRKVTAAEIAADPSLAPVRMKPRAIGPMMPQHELVLAGGHRVLVPGYRLADMENEKACLLAARDVVEASDEAWFDRSVEEMTFYNVVFDAHQIFCANGLPVESFVPSRRSVDLLDKSILRDIENLYPNAEDIVTAMPRVNYPAPDSESYRPEFL